MRCYFAYTWRDEDIKISIFLQYLKEKIEDYTEGEISVIYDKKDFKFGDNFENKEKLIYESDCIVIFFSSKYKERVETQTDKNGVCREYKKILKVKEIERAGIIPVIIDGDENSAVTNEFKKNVAAKIDISDIFKKDKNIKKKYEAIVEKLLRRIIRETKLANKKKKNLPGSKESMMEELFGESKARPNKKIPSECMYETDAYRGVMSQTTRYIIGRKGSGKTTFFDLLENFDVDEFEKRFKVLKPLKAEEINLEHVYAVLTSYKEDLTIFPIEKRLQLFWEIYTYIYAVFVVCLEEESFNIDVDDERYPVFEEAGIFLRDKLRIEKLAQDNCSEAIFTSAIETYGEFFGVQIVEDAQLESFLASLVANFHIDNVMKKYFGAVRYEKIRKAIVKCKKNILIALDGFDTLSDKFRSDTIHIYLNSDDKKKQEIGRKRLKFEGLFFRSMFNVFEKLYGINRGIMKNVSFCIIVPQDKIDQVKKYDRDFTKYNFASLSWDAIDLLKMLVIRLEYIFGIKDRENYDVCERFEYIMKKHFESIPLELEVKPGARECKMDLFLYILRLSFWRPRDIIKNFYQIYTVYKNNEKKGAVVETNTLKDVLYNRANEIIEEDFYYEYRTVITNISEIMDAFKGKNIVLEMDEIYAILDKQTFETAMLRDFKNPKSKFMLLYELGAVGFYCDQKVQNSENVRCKYCFNYNEGLEPLNLLNSDKIFEKGCIKAVINPIFVRKLSLKYNTRDIIENYSWDYLFRNHTRKAAIKRI